MTTDIFKMSAHVLVMAKAQGPQCKYSAAKRQIIWQCSPLPFCTISAVPWFPVLTAQEPCDATGSCRQQSEAYAKAV